MAKKKEDKEKNGKVDDTLPLEGLVLNYSKPRYPLVALAISWAKVLEKKQEFQHLRRNEVLELAMQDVLSEKVNKAAIAKAAAAVKAQAEEEEAEREKEEKETKEKTKDGAAKETAKKK